MRGFTPQKMTENRGLIAQPTPPVGVTKSPEGRRSLGFMFVSGSVDTPDAYTKDEQSRIRKDSGAIRAAASFASAAAFRRRCKAPSLAANSTK